MSAGPVGAAAGAAALAVALEQMRQEEEEMTPYSDRDLAEGWEFKIVRCTNAAFRKPEQFRALLEEERKGGWILVEKFDDSRVRLKRPAGAKAIVGDFADGYDPYRTMVGASPEQRLLIVLGCAFGFMLLMFLVLFLVGHN